MKKLVLFLYIDALNSSFLKPALMPFLSNFVMRNSYKVLDNVFGYSFAIQSCLLSGKYPDENNHWLPYFYSPEKAPLLFKVMRNIGKVFPLDRFPLLRHLTLSRTRNFVLEEGVRVNSVPFSLIDKLALYPYYYMCDLPFFHEFKLELAKKSGVPLTYIGPPTVKKYYYQTMLKHIDISCNEEEFVMVYDDILDGLGHRFGPYSIESIRYAQSLDKTLQAIYEKLYVKFGEKLTFLIFSDHGQCEQEYVVDILTELKSFGLKLGKDFFCFIDATLALFWPENNVKKEILTDVLKRIKGGTIIDDNKRKNYHLCFTDNRFGEIIFALNPGGTFFPNFFSPYHAMKGLHGYLPEEDVQKSLLISDKVIPQDIIHVKNLRAFFFRTCYDLL